MRQEVRIYPKDMKDVNIPLIFDFKESLTETRYIVTDNYTIVPGRDLTQSEKVLNHNFSLNNNVMKIVWDDDKDKKKGEAVKIIMKHPLIECDGNTNLRKAMFVLENTISGKRKKISKIKKANRILNIVNGMTMETVRNIAFWYGLNPINMQPEDIFIALFDIESGLVLKNMDDFLEKYDTDDVEYSVVAKKAITLGIFRKEKTFYVINNDQIGDTFEHVLNYCKQNTEMYSFVKKEVDKKDTLPVDIDWNKTVDQVLGDIEAEKEKGKSKIDNLVRNPKEKQKQEDDQLKTLQARAKELDIKQWHVKSANTLYEEIQKKEALQSAAVV